MEEKFKNQNKKYLIILSCSKRKKRVSNVCAIDLYDGPFFRIIRKNKPKNLDILILSAKYGLIEYNEKISYYEQKMSPERARELANEVFTKLAIKLKNTFYDYIAVNLGKSYILAFEKCKDILDEYRVYWIDGQIGERLHKFKNWINSINTEMKVHNDHLG